MLNPCNLCSYSIHGDIQFTTFYSLNYFLFHQFGDDYQNILLMSLSKNQEVILYETPTSFTLYITSKKYKNELPHCL